MHFDTVVNCLPLVIRVIFKLINWLWKILSATPGDIIYCVIKATEHTLHTFIHKFKGINYANKYDALKRNPKKKCDIYPENI